MNEPGSALTLPAQAEPDWGSDVAQRMCSIDGCERPHYGRGWCQPHYKRWYYRGDPVAPDRLRIDPEAVCAVVDCSEAVLARGWCSRHYDRWRVHGDPLLIADQTGESNPNWRGGVALYEALHLRLRERRGKASELRCACGRRAHQWAYDHSDPNEKQAPDRRRPGRVLVYSEDLERYVPMCGSCHRQTDIAHAKAAI